MKVLTLLTFFSVLGWSFCQIAFADTEAQAILAAQQGLESSRAILEQNVKSAYSLGEEASSSCWLNPTVSGNVLRLGASDECVVRIAKNETDIVYQQVIVSRDVAYKIDGWSRYPFRENDKVIRFDLVYQYDRYGNRTGCDVVYNYMKGIPFDNMPKGERAIFGFNRQTGVQVSTIELDFHLEDLVPLPNNFHVDGCNI